MAARGVYLYLIMWGGVGLVLNRSAAVWSGYLHWPPIAGMAISAIWLIQGGAMFLLSLTIQLSLLSAPARRTPVLHGLAWTSFVTFLVVTLASIGIKGYAIGSFGIATSWGDLTMIAFEVGVHGYLAYVLYCYASACSSGTHNEGAADVVVVNQVVVQQQMTSPVSSQVPVAQGTLRPTCPPPTLPWCRGKPRAKLRAAIA